jgi:hypothetical protein
MQSSKRSVKDAALFFLFIKTHFVSCSDKHRRAFCSHVVCVCLIRNAPAATKKSWKKRVIVYGSFNPGLLRPKLIFAVFFDNFAFKIMV